MINKQAGKLTVFDERDVFLLYVLGYGMTDVVLQCEQAELDLQLGFRKDVLVNATGDLFLHCRQIEDLIQLLKKYMADLFDAKDACLILLYSDHVSRLEMQAGEVIEVNAPKKKGLCGVCIEQRRPIHCLQMKRDDRYDPAIDLPMSAAEGGSLHSWPLYRGRLLSCVVQWSQKERSRVDFGDDGDFNELNPRHHELLGKMLALIQIYIEQWYPTLERLQSTLQKKIKKKMKMIMHNFKALSVEQVKSEEPSSPPGSPGKKKTQKG